MKAYRMRAARFCFIVAGVLTVAAITRAQERQQVHLDYAIEGREAGCLPEADFRTKVRARLGYDPFVDASPQGIRVRVVATAEQVKAHVEVLRGESVRGRRDLADASCELLADAVARTVAIAVDPIAAATPAGEVREAPAPIAPSPPPPPSPAPPAEAPSAGAPPESPARPPATPIDPFVGIDACGSLGIAPTPTLGAQLRAGLRRKAISVALEGRIDAMLTSAIVSHDDRVLLTVYSGALVPCAHIAGFFGCPVARIGALQGVAPGVSSPALKSALFASVGLRAGYALALGRYLAARASLEGMLPIVRTELVVDGAPVWTMPPFNASMTLGAEGRFW